MASDVADIRDLDELEVYGREHQASTIQIASYIFEVCCSMLNCYSAQVFHKFFFLKHFL